MIKKQANIIIALISFVIAVSGIVNNTFISTHNFDVMGYKDLLNPFYLDWLFSGHSLKYNGLNYVDSFFDFLLLIGAIIYIASGYKESRLIRFVFSIILLSNILIFLNPVILFIFKSYFTLWLRRLPLNLLYYTINAGWIYFAVKTLNYLKSDTQLKEEVFTEGEQNEAYFVKASNWQRLLHPLIDAIVTIALFSPLLSIFINYDAGSLFRQVLQIDENWAERHIVTILICLRIVYYLLSETVLGYTPAKFLTRTCVIDYNGTKPVFKKIAIRTISRLVPCESFSFFISDGWHDMWSETMVVKED